MRTSAMFVAWWAVAFPQEPAPASRAAKDVLFASSIQHRVQVVNPNADSTRFISVKPNAKELTGKVWCVRVGSDGTWSGFPRKQHYIDNAWLTREFFAELVRDVKQTGAMGLRVPGCSQLTDRDLLQLKDCTQLKLVDLSPIDGLWPPQFTVEALDVISQMPWLEYLYLDFFGQVSQTTFAGLPARDVDGSKGLVDRDILRLASLREMRGLSLRGLKGISGAGIRSLGVLPKLEHLDIAGCKLDQLTILPDTFSSLQSIDVSVSAVSDAFMSTMGRLPRLRVLVCRRVGSVSDRGLLDAVTSIAPAAHIFIGKDHVFSKGALEEARRKRPDVELRTR